MRLNLRRRPRPRSNRFRNRSLARHGAQRDCPLRLEVLEDRRVLATFAVTTTDDTVDLAPGDGFARDANGETSLRAAVMEANALPGDDEIVLPEGTFTLRLSAQGGRDSDAVDDLDVRDSSGGLTVRGAGQDHTTISAAGLVAPGIGIPGPDTRIFELGNGTSLALAGVTLRGGSVATNDVLTSAGPGVGGGGAILSRGGELTIADTTVTENAADHGAGGIDITLGTAHIARSTIAGNDGSVGGLRTHGSTVTIAASDISDNLGGGIESYGGTLTIHETTISGNQKTGPGQSYYDGGGIFSTGDLELLNSTVSGNTTEQRGGGVFLHVYLESKRIVLQNVTLSGNSALGGGGGVYIQSSIENAVKLQHVTVTGNRAAGVSGIVNEGRPIELTNSIIAGNLDLNGNTTADTDGSFLSSGGNLIQVVGNATGFDGADLTGVNPELGPLADNGGLTFTHAPALTSPAIDAGVFADDRPTTDQRRAPRVSDGNGDTMALPDSGAVEIAGSDIEAEIDVRKLTEGQDAGLPPGPGLLVGNSVNFRYLITNSGETPFFDPLEINDDNGTPNDPTDDFRPAERRSDLGANIGDVNNDFVFDIGETWEYVHDGTVSAGLHSNAVMVTARDVLGIAVSDQDVSHHFGIDGRIELEKQANGENADQAPGPVVLVGDPVTWTFRVQNIGNVALGNVSVTDDQTDVTPQFQSGDDNSNGQLDVGETWIYMAQGTAEPDQYTNVGTATAQILDLGGLPLDAFAMDADPSNYFGVDGKVNLEKLTNAEDADQAPGAKIVVGDPVTWTYTVENAGTVSLGVVTVTDDQTDVLPQFQSGDVNSNGLLDVGETWIYTAHGTAQPGQYTNVGTVVAALVDSAGMDIGISVEDFDTSNYLGVGALRGISFDDRNRNGIRDANELGTPGVVFLDDNGNGMLDAEERSTMANEDGVYEFDDLASGTYTVIRQLDVRTAQTSPQVETQSSAVFATPVIRSLAAADVDNDGDEDVIVAGDVEGVVVVLANDGHAGFEELTRIPVMGRPQTVRAADLSGDGNMDLAVTLVGTQANPGTSQVVVLIGAGDGSFVEGSRTPVGDGLLDAVVGDFDGRDGLDLAVTSYRSGEVILLMNDGMGNLVAGQRVTTGEQPISLGAGDVDRDGDLDLVVANYFSDNVVLVTNTANGFLVGPTIASGQGPGYLKLGDVNSDQVLDLAIAYYGRTGSAGRFEANDSVNVLIGSGDGTFADAQRIDLPPGARAEYVTFDDLNLDRNLDMLVVESELESNDERSLFGVIGVYRNDGEGGFERRKSSTHRMVPNGLRWASSIRTPIPTSPPRVSAARYGSCCSVRAFTWSPSWPGTWSRI